MPATLHLGDESKLRPPRAFAHLRPGHGLAPLAVTGAGEPYREVRLDAIAGESPLQTRRPFDPQDDEDAALIVSLSSDGQRVPVLLVEERQGDLLTYRPLDGHRRIAALRHLGRDTVKAVIYRADSLECDLITLTANVRKHLSPMEQARALARLRERHQLPNDAIAQKAGISRACFYQLSALLETDPAIQAEVEQSRLSAKAARELGKAPRSQQPELAAVAARYEVNPQDAERLVEHVAEGRQTPEAAALRLGLKRRSSEQTAPSSLSITEEPARVDAPGVEGARRLIVGCIPDLSPRVVQNLAEAAGQRQATSAIVKAATLLVSSGWEVADACSAAGLAARRPDIRKLLAMADLCSDLDNLIAEEKTSAECAPMLAALIRKLSAAKQAALQAAKKKAKR
jgi:ParB/RepB/Spo0J family partition protein